ncbi:MAG: hypothetical protein IPK73_00395 [Candidatus Obscuribacter sp.]|nr:hypothetical protein [Candidatus Obscuribacter sp.]
MARPITLLAVIALLVSWQAVSAAPESPNKQITLDFPDRYLYGWVGHVDWHTDKLAKKLKWSDQMSARGKVTVNQGSGLIFEGTGSICLHPEVLDKLPADAFVNMVFDNTEFDDSGAVRLGRFKMLERLSLEQTEVTDKIIDVVSGMPRLKLLFISRTSVKGKNLQKLCSLKELQFLRMSNNQLAEGVVAGLKDAKQLKRLDIRRCAVKDADILALSGLTELLSLELADNKDITDRVLQPIMGMKKLRWLDVSGTRITARALIKARLLSLYRINIFRDQYSQDEIKALRMAYPHIQLNIIDLNDKADPTIFAPLH